MAAPTKSGTDSKDQTTLNQEFQQLIGQLSANPPSSNSQTTDALTSLRILAREKTLTPDTLDQPCLDVLIEHARAGHLEAQKCLNNLILNYPDIRDGLVEPYVECAESRLAQRINDRKQSPLKNSQLTLPTSLQHQHDVLYNDLKIISILSQRCPEKRPHIRHRLADLVVRIVYEEAKDNATDPLIIEGLRTLFNLCSDRSLSSPLIGNLVKRLFTAVDPNFYQMDPGSPDKPTPTIELLVNTIYLMICLPAEVYQRLSERDADKVLAHLDLVLKDGCNVIGLRERVLPTLTACLNISKYNETVRKKWFDEIVASNKDYKKRPEELDTLKGRVVKLMTSADLPIKEAAAEFMYCLCNASTEDLILYAGFGNSAAFLSTRGLLNGDLNNSNSSGKQSDNLELRNQIDPITGRIESEPRKNPTEGMSEEEAEYRAHELADAITKLTNLGVIRPLGVGENREMRELHPGAANSAKPP